MELIKVETHLTGHWGHQEEAIGSFEERRQLVLQSIANAEPPFIPNGVYGITLTNREAPDEIHSPDFIVTDITDDGQTVTIKLSPQIAKSHPKAWWDAHYILPVYRLGDDKTLTIAHWVTYSKTHTQISSPIEPLEILDLSGEFDFFSAVSLFLKYPTQLSDCHLRVIPRGGTPEQAMDLRLKQDGGEVTFFDDVRWDTVEAFDEDDFNGTCRVIDVNASVHVGEVLTRWIPLHLSDVNLSIERQLEPINNLVALRGKGVPFKATFEEYEVFPYFEVIDFNPDTQEVHVRWVKDPQIIDPDNRWYAEPIFYVADTTPPVLQAFKIKIGI